MPRSKREIGFAEALEDFRATAEGVKRTYFATQGYTFAVPTVEIAKGGRKFIKLIAGENDPVTGEPRPGGSVHSFVEVATGDIFKPASYKAPAKHARGNIYRGNGADSMEAAGGIRYLR